MTSTATAAFTLDKWDPKFSEEGTEGAQFSRVAIAKTFTGEVDGTSTVEMLTAVTETSRAYVAFARPAVAVQGRKGTFVLHHTASEAGMSLRVLPGSGTGELTGISGTAEIIQDEAGTHTFKLDYDRD